MPILDFFILMVIVYFLANGIHAVTRKGMLLERFAFRLDIEDDLQEMNAVMAAERETVAFQFESGEIDEEEMNRQMDLILDNKQFRKLSNHANDLRKKWYIKLMLAVAPAVTECVVCMASFWSLLGMALYFTSTLYYAFPVILPLVVAGAQYVTHKK
jgi:hypothetical protein